MRKKPGGERRFCRVGVRQKARSERGDTHRGQPRRTGRRGGAAGGRARGGAALSLRAASGMQRPEAWPRPHPGEGASAAQVGGAAPPTRATELRVRSMGCWVPGWHGWGRGQQTCLGLLSWELCATTAQPRRGSPGPRRGEKVRSGACGGEEAWPEWSVAGLKFWRNSQQC